MRLLRGKSSQMAGLAPGTVVHIGEQKVEAPRITVFDYDGQHCDEHEFTAAEACLQFKDSPTTTWLNVSGVHDIALLEKLGACYQIHPLVMEDVGNTEQRPKLEDYRDYLFIVLKMLYCDDSGEIMAEQLSLIVGPNFVISFQENGKDVLESVRVRLRNAQARIRSQGSDYLAYSLIDAVVDHYFVILEKLAADIEEIEEDLTQNPTAESLRAIHRLKREILFLRKSVWPLREVINSLQRRESPLIRESTVVYLRDVYDHAIQVMDTMETYRDMVSGMLETYLSSVSNRLNEVMKVLTIIATIFIPLTFIAGVYGMNFRHMPELEVPWAYPALLCLMVAVGLGMLVYFRRRRWL